MGAFTINLTRTGTSTKDVITTGDFFRDINAGGVSDDKIVINGIQYDLNSGQYATTGEAALTVITHTAAGTPDFAIQDLISTAGSSFGFVTKDEGNSVLAVIKNLQARVATLEGGA